MRSISIGLRAFLVFFMLLLMMVVIGFIGINNQKQINLETRVIQENQAPLILKEATIRNIYNRITVYRRENTIDVQNGRPPRHTSIFGEEVERLKTLEAEMEGYLLSDYARQVFKEFVQLRVQMIKEITEINELLSKQMLEEATRLSINYADKTSEEALERIVILFNLAEKGINDGAIEAEAVYQNGIIVSSLILALAILASLVVAILFIKSLTQPINYAVKIAETIAANDLTEDIQLSGNDEAAQMLAALQVMQQNLEAKVSAIINSSTQLSASAEELSVVTNQTSRGVQAQRAETEQVATAMNEMTATVQEVAQNSEAAASTTVEVTQQAQLGEDHLQDAVSKISTLAREVENTDLAIQQLSKDSQEINTVLVVINDIAEQTNLLALNAAIEAARAGDAGRGFAVVADEVRNLAQRTQESTSQIENLIANLQAGSSSAVKQMEASRSLADETARLAEEVLEELHAITVSVQGIQDMSSQIATASEEQSSVAEEINRSIIRVNDIADQSAAAVEQTSASANELARLSQELQSLVNEYKVKS